MIAAIRAHGPPQRKIPGLSRRWTRLHNPGRCPSSTSSAAQNRLLADKPLSTGRLSEYPTDYSVGICIEISAVAEQNTLWLPRVDFSDFRLRLLPLEE